MGYIIKVDLWGLCDVDDHEHVVDDMIEIATKYKTRTDVNEDIKKFNDKYTDGKKTISYKNLYQSARVLHRQA